MSPTTRKLQGGGSGASDGRDGTGSGEVPTPFDFEFTADEGPVVAGVFGRVGIALTMLGFYTVPMTDLDLGGSLDGRGFIGSLSDFFTASSKPNVLPAGISMHTKANGKGGCCAWLDSALAKQA
jgi:hypothetical protein